MRPIVLVFSISLQADSDWTNTAWTDHLNVLVSLLPKVISGVISMPGYEKGEVRFQDTSY